MVLKIDLLSYQISLKQQDVKLQREVILQKLLRVAFHTVFLRGFTIFASCKLVSMTLFLVTKKV